MMSLLNADLGSEMRIERCCIKGGLKKHTESLGLIPGEVVTPISRNDGGVIVKVRESRFAVTSGIASKIYVA